MPNGADYLPPGTTYADLDAHFGGPSRRRDMEDLTEDEQRAERLSDPLRHGFCFQCAAAGELTQHLNHSTRCRTCIENDVADDAAIEQMLLDLDRHGIDRYSTETTARRVIEAVWPLLSAYRIASGGAK